MSLTISRDISFFCMYDKQSIENDNFDEMDLGFKITHNLAVEKLKKIIARIPGFQWTMGSASVLIYAARQKNNSGLISYIVKEAGLDLLELADSAFQATPLWHAAHYNGYDAVKTLITLGAKVNVIGKDLLNGGYTSSLETALSYRDYFDNTTDHRVGYPIAKLLLKNGARIQKSTPYLKEITLFHQEFSSEIAPVSAKNKEIYEALGDDFPPEVSMTITGYAIDKTEVDAYDFVQAEFITKQREKIICEMSSALLILDLSRTINEYDEGESYKNALEIREPA